MGRQQVQGDGFATMMLSQGEQLMRVAWHVLHEHHLAEDAVAGSYLRAWQRRGSLRDQGKLGPWLRTICRREALRLARASQRWPQREADGFVMARVSDKIVTLPGDTTEVRELVERLPKHLRTCAGLFLGANHTYREIAGATGLPLSTVRGRIRLARERLQKEMRMSTEKPSTRHGAQEIIHAEKGRVRWEGVSFRLLGACWSGSSSLYSPSGQRLTHLPTTLARAHLLPVKLDRPFGPMPYSGPVLSIFWELSGGKSDWPDMVTVAHDSHAGLRCLPSGHQPRIPLDDRGLDQFLCVPPDTASRLRVQSQVLGKEDRTSPNVLRWDFEFDRGLDTCITVERPGWGAACAFPPQPGKESGRCLVTVVLSSLPMEKGCQLVGLDRDRREVEPLRSSFLGSSFLGGTPPHAEGHLIQVQAELPLEQNGLYGVVLYPRRHATLDWGRIPVPPRPKSED
jgi:RNA polymerase sigma-70 factor (ECF subfamily)